jgi:hypothetical protein
VVRHLVHLRSESTAIFQLSVDVVQLGLHASHIVCLPLGLSSWLGRDPHEDVVVIVEAGCDAREALGLATA